MHSAEQGCAGCGGWSGGERVGGGPAPAQQTDTGSNFLQGSSFPRQAPCVTLQSLLLVKPARVSAVPTQAILPFDLKIHFFKDTYFFFKSLLLMETSDFLLLLLLLLFFFCTENG